MIHWAFLIPAFLAGLVVGYVITNRLVELGARITATIRKSVRSARMLDDDEGQ